MNVNCRSLSLKEVVAPTCFCLACCLGENGHMQEKRLIAEEAAHVAIEETIRNAVAAHAAKREEAGNASNLSS